MTSFDHQQDYVWHFKLSEDADRNLCDDALTEMVRRELKALLGCVALTQHGRRVRVTGFRFLGEPDEEHPIFAPAGDRHATEDESRADTDPGSRP